MGYRKNTAPTACRQHSTNSPNTKISHQALPLRASRKFADLGAYEQFVAETVRRLNARCARAWEVERARLKTLPVRRTVDFEELTRE